MLPPLAVALVTLQLAFVYPDDHYLVLLFLASLTLCLAVLSSRAEGIFIVLVLSTSAVVVTPPPSERSPCGDSSIRVGRVHSVTFRGSERIVLLQEDSVGRELSLPDLPWVERFGSGALIRFRERHCRALPQLRHLPPWDYSWHLLRQGIETRGQGELIEVVSSGSGPTLAEKFLQDVFEALPDSDALSVLLAANLGRGELLSRETEVLFRNTATTHLLVVSGFHVAVISRAIGALALSVLRLRPLLFLLVPAPICATVLGLIGALSYGALIGFSLTVQRAVFALFLHSVFQLVGRRGGGYRSIILAFISTQILWPLSVFEPGCELTFAALFGLTLAAHVKAALKERWFPPGDIEVELNGERIRRRELLFRVFIAPTVESFIVWLTTSAVALLWFSYLVPSGPLVNLIIIPIFTWGVILFGGTTLLVFALTGVVLPLKVTLVGVDLIICAREYAEEVSERTLFRVRPLSGIALLVSEIALLLCVILTIRLLLKSRVITLERGSYNC